MSEKSDHRWELPIDPWRFVEALRQRWPWLALGGACLALLGFAWGYWAGRYAASVKLVRSDLPALVNAGGGTGAPMLRPVAVEELVSLAQSPALIRRAAQTAQLSLTTDQVAACAQVSHMTNAGLITIQVSGQEPAPTVRLANAYAEEVVRIAQAMQSNEVQEAASLLKDQLRAVDQDLEQTSQELVSLLQKSSLVDFEKEPSVPLQQWTELNRKCDSLRNQTETLDLQIQSLLKEVSKYMPTLVTAKAALDQALLRYTEEHPKVKELRGTIAALEAQLAERGLQTELDVASWGNSPAVGLYNQVVELRRQRIALEREREEANRLRQQLEKEIDRLPAKQLAYAKVKSQFQSLRENRELLVGRQQKLRLWAEKFVGCYRIVERASADDLGRSEKWKGGMAGGVLGGVFGTLAAILLIWLLEWTDGRVRSSEDLRRITRLPVLATLGDLSDMSDEERQRWAFRTLTSLKGTLNPSNTAALVCGFISATHGEGRSTWIHLLAEVANKIGYQALTISALPSPPSAKLADEMEPRGSGPPASQALQLPSDILSAPLSPSTPLVRHLSMPGGTWDLERRAQWRDALQQWHASDNLVVLVELPPAFLPESILLAEHLPHVIWLCGKDMARATDTRSHLETLRHGRSHLAGSVFNRGAKAAWTRRSGQLLGTLMVLGALLPLHLVAQPAEPPSVNPESPNTNAPASISASSPDRLAGWQKRLTLGPGDVLDISIYEQTESARTGLAIGPDGTINYLEARDVVADGLTVDELRTKLEAILAKFRRTPRVIVHPVAYNSKKYYLLGNVNLKGVFPLDRPTSVIEAIARARGFVTGGPASMAGAAAMPTRNPLVQADLPRSFLIRKGANGAFGRMDVDFEGLFLRGDLSQNVALEPDDYLFFPPPDLQEVYVLGEVRTPGVVPYSPDTTALGAIVARGSFTEVAWRQKILVVRGALSRPQTFVVDAAAVLSAKGPDFPLSNRDIVYVHRKPWAKAAELTELAITSFANAFIIGWASMEVGPFITEPIVP